MCGPAEPAGEPPASFAPANELALMRISGTRHTLGIQDPPAELGKQLISHGQPCREGKVLGVCRDLQTRSGRAESRRANREENGFLAGLAGCVPKRVWEQPIPGEWPERTLFAPRSFCLSRNDSHELR